MALNDYRTKWLWHVRIAVSTAILYGPVMILLGLTWPFSCLVDWIDPRVAD